jgi:hypothetical protein
MKLIIINQQNQICKEGNPYKMFESGLTTLFAGTDSNLSYSDFKGYLATIYIFDR